jgi:hypothetical protein
MVQAYNMKTLFIFDDRPGRFLEHGGRGESIVRGMEVHVIRYGRQAQ